jgi:hypothetical protein
MIVYFSTVIRAAPIPQGGELVALDWERKTIVARHAVIPGDPPLCDPNPRGGTRGGRGILIRNGEVLVASYHTLHSFDRNLRPTRELSNPLFANLHEMCWDGDNIWSSSTAIDAAVKISADGAPLDAWWAREDPVVARRFEISPLEIDKRADNRATFVDVGNTAPGHVHLNAVTLFDGHPVVVLNRYGCIVRLYPTEVLFEDPLLQGCHNLVVTPDGHLLINNSRNRSLDVFSAKGRLVCRHKLDKFPIVRSILRKHRWQRTQSWLARHGQPRRLFQRLFTAAVMSRPVFVRGLCLTPGHSVLVGISPAAILELDWKSGRLIDQFIHATDVCVCVHGLAVG